MEQSNLKGILSPDYNKPAVSRVKQTVLIR